MTSGADVKSRNPADVIQAHIERKERQHQELIGSFTTQELLEELKGRDGVDLYVSEQTNTYHLEVMDSSGTPDQWCVGDGEATIIVVRGKE